MTETYVGTWSLKIFFKYILYNPHRNKHYTPEQMDGQNSEDYWPYTTQTNNFNKVNG
jgi:hypothetical protein